MTRIPCKHFIGHIDLLLVDDDTLIVSDYKPVERKVLKSLPQITAYALLLRDILKKKFDVSKLKMKCIGFSKDLAIEWNPDLLFREIINFTLEQNKKREIQLMTAHRTNKKNLLIELKKLKD